MLRCKFIPALKKAGVALSILLLSALASFAQSTVNLTAARQTTTLPDGRTVAMWGWVCGTGTTVGQAQGGTGTAVATAATCTATNGVPQVLGAPATAASGATPATPGNMSTTWQPPLIVMPTGNTLSITLTNNLPVETSLAIVGQLPGGGLGTPVREAAARNHPTQTEATWTINIPATFTPPIQGLRARSFVSEATPNTGSQVYTWSTPLNPGSYLIESGTYPSIQGPMGLYGILIVTGETTSTTTTYTPGPGTAYPNITYDAAIPLLLSEIDPNENGAVEKFVETVAGCPTTTPGTGTCTGVIDAAHATTKWTPACGTAGNCYPAAVNYTPLYYLVNGVTFDLTATTSSAAPIPSPAAGFTGNVLLRFVNAGLRIHAPSVNGLSMSLIAEDSNVVAEVTLAAANHNPLTARVQSSVFLTAGKSYDVMISPANNGNPATSTAATAYTAGTYLVYDRELSLSADSSRHDSGMETFLQIAGGLITNAATNAKANPDSYFVTPGITLTVADPGKGVVGNDVNINGVQILTAPTHGTLALNADGTFTYVPTGWTTGTSDSFVYYGNNNKLAANLQATVTLAACTGTCKGNAPTAGAATFSSNVASLLKVNAPGVLAFANDPSGYPLTATVSGTPTGATVTMNADGSFTAIPATPCATAPPAGCTYTFNYIATNSQGTASTAALATLHFYAGSGLLVTVQDAQDHTFPINDYKWLIQQDLTYHLNPACQQNGPGANKPATCPTGLVPNLGTNFHTSYMPVIAVGCTGPQSCEAGQTIFDAGVPCTATNTPAGCSPTAGQHLPAKCDGSGICYPDPTSAGLPQSFPAQALLNATNPDGSPASYYISILPGDSANPFNTGNVSAPVYGKAGCLDPSTIGTPNGGTTPTGAQVTKCGHTMGGAPIPAPVITGTGAAATATFAPVVVNVEANPLPTAQVTVYVFEDDFPLNGEPDAGGGIDVLATNEPGLDDFEVELWDDAGGSGDATGQMTYDIFNEPLTNALNGMSDPQTGLDACPISNAQGLPAQSNALVGVIIVCPRFESDGTTLSPLAGQAVVKNLMPGRFGIIVHPGARREARGEEWLQTNTLDGTHFLDSFVKMAEPAYFQEYGPGGYHVFMGMANPAIINGRLKALCTASLANPTPPACNNTVTGQVTNLHMSRPPNETLYSSGVFPHGATGNYAPLSFTSCYVSLGDPDGQTIALTKCDADGNYTFTGIPTGNWGIVVFDQWLDLIVDGSSKAVNIPACPPAPAACPAQTMTVDYSAFTWQTHIWNRAYMDVGGLGRPVLTATGDLDPLLSPGLIQIPVRVRMRNGKFNNTLFTTIAGQANFNETFPLFNWYVIESDTTRFKGTGVHVVNDFGGPLDGAAANGGNGNTGSFQAILNSKEVFPLPSNLHVPGAWYCLNSDCTDQTGVLPAAGGGSGGSTARIDPGSVTAEGVQSFISQTVALDWGKQPYAAGENGGIHGHTVYSSTRPFDDPAILFQNLWEPLVPNVTMNLYQEGTAPDGTKSLTLIDTTKTSSWDAWAQGFRAPGIPNMNCPGQDTADPFFNYTLNGSRYYLNPNAVLPSSSQYKCYDGLHVYNQIQPAPYDGMYQFPSPNCHLATAGGPGCVVNPTTNLPAGVVIGTQHYILPPGKYVVEAVTPPGYELVKEEDKNILIGDNFIAPVTQQFGGIVNIFIVPDQATVNNTNPSYTGPVTLDSVTLINLSAGGSGYTTAPAVTLTTVTGDTGSGATATAVLTGGAVTSVRVTNTGSGYGTAPTVAVAAPPSCAGAPGSCTATGTAVLGAFNPQLQNPGNPTTNMGRTGVEGFGPGGLITQNTPCVGAMRVVPDFMSISPQSGEVAPFAGATRPLCDRKEVTLEDQMQGVSDFFVWTKTPAATGFVGFILDDMSSEFDPTSPTFGEKFAVPNTPIAIKDYNGVEIYRTYSDQWGLYNGLIFSTWEVNPPNPTGYSPGMLVTCMNDPGPIPDPAHPGKMMTDPYYNPMYSNFCYENPFMPGDTTYLDTPVVPTAAFAEGYNPPDCAYPDATPAIASVTSSDIAGPWVSASGTGHTLTITALGNQTVPNHAYSGPAAATAPYNLKSITRHYGFGNTRGSVTIAGVTATVTAWSDTSITVTVPDISRASNCAIQQNRFLVPAGTTQSYCGELVITAGNGKQSIDAVTVTVGGKKPTVLLAGQTIQSAIDAAIPGDMIIVPPGTYNEMVIMWKPVRLQGVGAAAATVYPNAHPAGKLLEPWRRQVNCLYGLALNGGAISGTNAYDPSTTFTCTSAMQGQVDRLPGESTVGWDATTNGNLAELLQEPSLMGAYEGAGITVLGKGMMVSNGANAGSENAFPTGSRALTAGVDCNPANIGDPANPNNPAYYVGNFLCNPSSIDGLSVSGSSQGGGGIFIHGWDHDLQVANNRIFTNSGTLTGGITVSQGEFIDATLDATGLDVVPYGYNNNVYIHNNSITMNTSFGDELGSSTPASGGGVTFCTGSDYYVFSYNWVCGNMSTGDGGGVAHFGYSVHGTIEHNSFLFNQSFNTTLTTYGGGVMANGAPPDGMILVNGVSTECGASTDIDCQPGLSDGIGPGLKINANLFIGNTAESGSGGAIRLEHINGTDVQRNPTAPAHWNDVAVTNNIIANNVAGWNGGGISLQDAVRVSIVNNTIVSNDSTSSAGVLFDSLGAPVAGTPPPGCDPATNPNCTGFQVTTSNFQPAGVATQLHEPQFAAAFPTTGGSCFDGRNTFPNCNKFSNPVLANNILWQNRSFHITTSATPPAGQPQNTVTLVPALSQTQSGQCMTGATYWDIGVYGDTAPGNHASHYAMNPQYSILGDFSGGSGYSGTNRNANPAHVRQSCNGSRVPPEIAPTICVSAANAPGCTSGGTGITTPPGATDTNPNPNYPLFTLLPAATVDEGNNWINMFYGPLSLTNASAMSGNANFGVPLGNYDITSNSPARTLVPGGGPTRSLAPPLDFFGRPRTGGSISAGAIQFASRAAFVVTVTSLNFNSVVGVRTGPQSVVVSNTGNVPVNFTGNNLTFIGNATGQTGAARFTLTNTCSAVAPGSSCTMNVTFLPNASGTQTATLFVNYFGAPAGAQQTVLLTGTTVIPTFTIAPATLTFGPQQIGSRSAAQPVTITNTGTVAVPFTASMTGTNAASFGQTNTCAGSVPVAGNCTINVTYAPTLPVGTTRTATLSVAVTGVATASTVTLNGGTATSPTFTVPATPLAFGFQANGQTSTPLTVTITNTSGASGGAITVNTPTVINQSAGSVFAVTNNCPSTLPAAAGTNTCTISVTFTPSTTGSKTATLQVSVTAPIGGTPAVTAVPLSGSVLTFSTPNPTLFAGASGVTTRRGTVTVTNTGTTSITLGAVPTVVKVGTAGGTFTTFTSPLVGTVCTASTPIPAGGSCVIGVQYAPGGSTATATAHMAIGASATQIGGNFPAN